MYVIFHLQQVMAVLKLRKLKLRKNADVIKVTHLRGQSGFQAWIFLISTITHCDFETIQLIFASTPQLTYENKRYPHQILGGYAS